MTTTVDVAPPPGPRPPRRRGDRVRTALRGLGEVLISVGLVLLLFVVYEMYWTDVVSAGKQREVTASLEQSWAAGDDPLIDAPAGNPAPDTAPDTADTAPDALADAPASSPNTVGAPQGTTSVDVAEGQGFAKLHIPSFGPDFEYTVLEGTTQEVLAGGPGHYTGTAFPGEAGNFAVAGHRVTNGAPFNDLDELRSCDALIAETATAWYVYRVLPMAEEMSGWADGRGSEAACSEPAGGAGAPVVPLDGAYEGLPGRQIVLPSRSDVIAPVPGDADAAVPAGGDAEALLTLTTCHPQFSARERMIIHAALVQTWAKDGSAQGELPPEMREG